MKILKSYTQCDVNGFTVERKFSQPDQIGINVNISLESKLIPFAMDPERKEFIIFMIERQEKPNLFIWVHFLGDFHGKTVRVTIINELMQFTRWTDEPMDVSGNYPDEIINAAVQKLQAWSADEIKKDLLDFDKWMNSGGNSQRWKEYEHEILKTVKKAKKENNGLMLMY